MQLIIVAFFIFYNITKEEIEINIRKTNNDTIVPEHPEGLDPYTYEWYNLKPDCTGKRFKVDDTGKIPNEALEYEENKKESDKRGKKTVILYCDWLYNGDGSNFFNIIKISNFTMFY